MQSWSVLCPEQLHWGRFCLGGCGIPPLRVITEGLIPLCTAWMLHHKCLCTYKRACKHGANRQKRAFTLELIRLVWLMGEKSFELTYLHISCVKRSPLEMNVKVSPDSQKFPQTHKHARTHTQISHPGDSKQTLPKEPQSYLKSIKCSKSSPHLWTQGKRKTALGAFRRQAAERL